MAGLAPELPLRIDEIDGAYKLVTNYVRLVEQNLKMLLLTAPGEKIMNPDYGVGLRRYLFENNITQTQTQSQVKSRILSQVSIYMPYLDVTDVRLTAMDDNANGINVYIEYIIVPLNIEKTLELTQQIDSIF